MDWRDTIADGLPAPQKGEPESLRQDIADELADHLCCALERERQRTPDEPAARSNVLARFGDVRRIARRLWLDAMKEKLMAQRITLGLVAVMAVACLAAVALAWVAVQDSREVNAAILQKLTTLSDRPAADPVPLDWIPVTIKLVQEGRNDAPAAGFTAALRGNLLSESHSITLEKQTGDDGRIAFGLVRPGSYLLSITAPWGEQLTHSITITVVPGSPFTQTIVCPSKPPKEVPVTINVEWPDGLPDETVRILAAFRRAGRIVGGRQWTWPMHQSMHSLLFTPSGEIRSFQHLTLSKNDTAVGFPSPYISAEMRPTPSQPATGEFRDQPSVATPLRWLTGQYVQVAVGFAIAPDSEQAADGRMLKLIGVRSDEGDLGGSLREPFVRSARERELVFEVAANQPNRWTLKVPELTDLVRAYQEPHRELNNQQTPQASPARVPEHSEKPGSAGEPGFLGGVRPVRAR